MPELNREEHIVGKHNKDEDLDAKAYEFDLQHGTSTVRAAENRPTQEQRIESLKEAVGKHRRLYGSQG